MSLEDVMWAISGAAVGRAHTALPGRVLSYDAASQTADVKPMVRGVVLSQNEDFNDQTEELPAVPRVPVLWPRSGGFYFHAPLAAGDSVLLVFLERDASKWIRTGELSDPADLRMHSLAHAVALPGLFPAAQALEDASAVSLTLGEDGGLKVEVTGSQIKMAAGDQSFVRGDAFLSELNDVLDAESDAATARGAAFLLCKTKIPGLTDPEKETFQAAADADSGLLGSVVAAIASAQITFAVPGAVLSTKIKGE